MWISVEMEWKKMKKSIKTCSNSEIWSEAYRSHETSTTNLSRDNCKFCTLATDHSCGIKCENDMSIIDYDAIRNSEYKDEEIEVEE